MCIGAVHLDFPSETLKYPCYALFLDAANALTIRGKDLIPRRDPQGVESLVPKPILSTTNAIREIFELPKGPQTLWFQGNKEPESQFVELSEDSYRKVWEYWKGEPRR